MNVPKHALKTNHHEAEPSSQTKVPWYSCSILPRPLIFANTDKDMNHSWKNFKINPLCVLYHRGFMGPTLNKPPKNLWARLRQSNAKLRTTPINPVFSPECVLIEAAAIQKMEGDLRTQVEMLIDRRTIATNEARALGG
jgi:hypothetical protein